MGGVACSHGHPHADQAVLTKLDAFAQHTAAADETARADPHAAIHQYAGGNVAVVFDNGVVFDEHLAVENAVPSNSGAGIDDDAVHDNASGSQAGMARYMGPRGDDVGQDKAETGQQVEEAHAWLRRLDLADRDQGVGTGGPEFRQLRIRAQNRITENLAAHFFG